jgi:hypothetical protein
VRFSAPVRPEGPNPHASESAPAGHRCSPQQAELGMGRERRTRAAATNPYRRRRRQGLAQAGRPHAYGCRSSTASRCHHRRMRAHLFGGDFSAACGEILLSTASSKIGQVTPRCAAVSLPNLHPRSGTVAADCRWLRACGSEFRDGTASTPP